MPFKSRSQMRKFAIMEKEGKLAKGTTERWAAETPSTKKLPERATKSKDVVRTVRSVADIKRAAKRFK